MRSNHIVSILCGILLLTCSAPSRADTLDAPAKVFADDTGAFSYDAVFTASDPVIIAGFEINGPPANNVNIGIIIADCFCPPTFPGCPVVPAVPFVIPVAGSLLDVSQDGTVTVQVFICDGETFEVKTIITHFSPPVPAVSEWGMASVVLLLLTGLTIKFGAMRFRKAA